MLIRDKECTIEIINEVRKIILLFVSDDIDNADFPERIGLFPSHNGT